MATNFETCDESALGEAFIESPLGEARNGDGTGDPDLSVCDTYVENICGLAGDCIPNECPACVDAQADTGCAQYTNEVSIGGGDCSYTLVMVCCNQTSTVEDCTDCACT